MRDRNETQIIERILDICIDLDSGAAELYKSYGEQLQDKTDVALFCDMGQAETVHVGYWKKLKVYLKKGMLPKLFDDSEKMLEELEAKQEKIHAILRKASPTPTFDEMVMMGMRLEFYLLHPVFMRFITVLDRLESGLNVVENYNSHINDTMKLIQRARSESLDRELMVDVLGRFWFYSINLEQLNESKNVFLGMAAHDLRNPIAAIRGYAQSGLLGLFGDIEDPMQSALNRIISLSDHMISLINDTLDISAIEMGQVNLVFHDTPINDLVRQSVALCYPLAQRRHLIIEVNEDPHNTILSVDRMKFGQVIENLTTNALKYSPSESKIIIDIARQEESLTISVSDEGPGISEEDREKLFVPFAKGSTTTQDGEKSTGLGLTIARRIIHGHDGSIEVHNKKSGGTVFSVSLPLKPRHSA